MATGLITLLGFASSIILARYFGKNEYGRLIIVYTAVSFFAIFTNFGVGEAIIRFMPKYITIEDKRGLNLFVFSTGMLVLVLSALFSFILFRSANLIALSIYNRPEVVYIVQIGSIYLFCYSIFYYLASIYRGLQSWKIEAILTIFPPLVYFFGILLVTKSGIRIVDSVLFSNICAYGISIVLGIAFLCRERHIEFPKISIIPIFSTIKDTLIFSHPLLISSFTFYLMMWFDRLILGVSDTNEALSIYYVATMMVSGFMMIFKVLFEVLSPFVAEIDPSNVEEINTKFQFLFKWFFHISFLLIIVMFYIIDPLVFVAYGENWATTAVIMKVLLLAFLLRATSNPIRMFLVNVFQETKKVAKISVLVLVTNVILSLIFIPLFSYWGAVVSTILSLMVGWFYMAFYIEVIREILPFRLIFKTMISFGILIVTNLIFQFIGVHNSLILLSFSLILFLVLQIVQGEIHKEDFKFCWQIIKVNCVR